MGCVEYFSEASKLTSATSGWRLWMSWCQMLSIFAKLITKCLWRWGQQLPSIPSVTQSPVPAVVTLTSSTFFGKIRKKIPIYGCSGVFDRQLGAVGCYKDRLVRVTQVAAITSSPQSQNLLSNRNFIAFCTFFTRY